MAKPVPAVLDIIEEWEVGNPQGLIKSICKYCGFLHFNFLHIVKEHARKSDFFLLFLVYQIQKLMLSTKSLVSLL